MENRFVKVPSWVLGARQIGRGGNARVFEAVIHDKKVAVKYIPARDDNSADILNGKCTSRMYGFHEYCKHILASKKFPNLVDRPIGLFFGITRSKKLSQENSSHKHYATSKSETGVFIVMQLWPNTLRDIMGTSFGTNKIMNKVLSKIRDVVVSQNCSHGDIKHGFKKLCETFTY